LSTPKRWSRLNLDSRDQPGTGASKGQVQPGPARFRQIRNAAPQPDVLMRRRPAGKIRS